MERWHNIDVELFDYESVGDMESVRVRVARSPAGDQRDAVTVTLPTNLRSSLTELAADKATLDQTIQLGQQLAELLFVGEGVKLFETSRAQLSPNDGLRIRIELRAMALAELPWEYAYWLADVIDTESPERGFLGLNRRISIVRYEAVAQAASSCQPLRGDDMKVAMLLANPDIPGWGKLDLEQEASIVSKALSGEEAIQLSVWDHANEAMLNEVLDGGPHVIHFSGHGQFKMQATDQFGVFVGQGQLLFETSDGKVNAINATELARKMRGTGVRLAILNSCESARRDSQRAFTGIAPTLIRDGIPAVIAMQYSVRDSQALLFTQRLYHNLAEQQSIDSAVTAARLAMFDGANQYFRDWGIPVLYLRSNESVLFPDEVAITTPISQRLSPRAAINLLLSAGLVFALAFVYLRHIEPRLPLGSIVGGVLAVALVTSVSYLMTVGGEALRNVLLRAFDRKRTAVVLLAGVLLATFVMLWLPPPMALRIVAGPTLLGRIPSQNLDNPMANYKLRVTSNAREEDFDDFRKSGLVVADGKGLARRLMRRHDDQFQTFLDAFLQKNPQIVEQENFRREWNAPSSQLALRGLGRAKHVTLRLFSKGKLKACRSFAKEEFTQTVSVIVLEMRNECDPPNS